MSDQSQSSDAPGDLRKVESASKPASTPRKIPGNLPYLTASGTLKKTLQKLIDAQRPEKFTVDFLENVLKQSGGAARATIPILKKMGFLASDGSPTDLYAKFRTTSGRSLAALQGLRNSFSEIFRRSEYAHSADDQKLRDMIVEITGLKGNDPIAQAIRSTFNVVKSFITQDAPENAALEDDDFGDVLFAGGNSDVPKNIDHTQPGIGLVYNINIILPETSDLRVLNAIFISLKENLMK